MRFHHLGIACEVIETTLDFVRATHTVKEVSQIVFDPKQDASVCMVTVEDGPPIELIAGKRVEGLLKRKISLYHVCYEVADLDAAISRFVDHGATMIAAPQPAALFNQRRVAFLASPIGIVELVEGPGSHE